MSILKEGFLEKRDDAFMFPGWKKKHCMLKSDGEFLIGDGKHVHHHFNTKINLKKIEIGFEAGSVNLPKGKSDIDAMFVLHTTQKKYYLMAGSNIECREWVGMIENSKSSTSSARAPQMGSYVPPMQATAPPPYSASHPTPGYNPNYP